MQFLAGLLGYLGKFVIYGGFITLACFLGSKLRVVRDRKKN